MPYVRTRGNQLALVHGEREPETGKVQQRVLFTIYSKPEALEILGRGSSNGKFAFQQLLQGEHPELSFSWKKILRDIETNLAVLPARYGHEGEQLVNRFRKDLCAFTRQLILTDPQHLHASAQLIQQHRHELEYLADLIQWRLKLHQQEPDQWNADNPFHWRFTLQGRTVPPDTEEHAAGFYERGEYEKADAIFRLLIDCFGDYADGYNYLGLIAYQQYKLEDAMAHFEKTMELGRKLFPRRIAKKRYWRDHHTRPYMRGLRNLILTLNEAGEYERALRLCERLEEECGDDYTAADFKASTFLNTGEWRLGVEAAQKAGGELNPAAGFVEAFARFELGQMDESLALCLEAALHFPRAARMLVGLPTKTPKSYHEARDDNMGIHVRRILHAYLKKQSPQSKKFFSSLVKDPRVIELLDESIAVAQRWSEQRSSNDRSAFDRMKLLHSREFARSEAHQLRDLIVSACSTPISRQTRGFHEQED